MPVLNSASNIQWGGVLQYMTSDYKEVDVNVNYARRCFDLSLDALAENCATVQKISTY